ncbi:Vi polysaccharide biosynthesis UDP-N-acetylglucosamine C-6 dehydrogenase TviB, partial [Pseudomonadales bacterium]|nr:Vi polysaccharide biosynthesis UDP-N-acetylglucosamine C-6 dehydrogenase TviB [Pseudomonadales bacterium]
MIKLEDAKIGIVGLGYVGLPLAVEFGKHYETVGFDINEQRVKALNTGVDETLEVSSQEMQVSQFLRYTNNSVDLLECDVYIVTVPTPIDQSKRPDLTPLEAASRLVGQFISPGNVVIY